MKKTMKTFYLKVVSFQSYKNARKRPVSEISSHPPIKDGNV